MFITLFMFHQVSRIFIMPITLIVKPHFNVVDLYAVNLDSFCDTIVTLLAVVQSLEFKFFFVMDVKIRQKIQFKFFFFAI